MNKMKSQNLLAALSLMVMVSACGKSMSLQVNGQTGVDSKNQTSGSVDTTKSKMASTNACEPAKADAGAEVGSAGSKKLSPNESLENFSEYDMNELKDALSKDSLLKRSTLQIAPKDAIKEVTELKLTLVNAVVKDLEASTICIVETQCRPLKDLIVKAQENKVAQVPSVLELDLREVFGLKDKSNAELVDWIYASSTEFARPGYRKFRFTFEGITSVDSGSLLVQVITNEKLPANFATAPTCYEHGDEDRNDEETPAKEDEAAKPQTDAAAPTAPLSSCGMGMIRTQQGCLETSSVCAPNQGFSNEAGVCLDSIE